MKYKINDLREVKIKTDNLNITQEQAILIANANKCLKDSIFFEGLESNLKYGYIGFSKFGVKKIIYHEVTAIDSDTGNELYLEREAWYIKVLEGEYGATEFRKNIETGDIEEIAYLDGDLSDKNICCLVFIDSGEYLYLTNDLMKYIKNKN